MKCSLYMRIKRSLSYCFNSVVLLNIGTQTLVEASFYGLLPGSLSFQQRRHLKVRSNICVPRDVLKALFNNVSYVLLLPDFSILVVEYF